MVRGGDEAFVIDSPVLPSELEILPAVLERSGFPLSGLLATHGDWDHLLGRLAFPDAALGVAETTAALLTGEPGAAQRELREFDDRWYVKRERPLALGAVQALPVPGKLELGGGELELHPADGHTPDGMAVWDPAARVLVCGDYLSPVEIPMITEHGSRDAYVATLERPPPLVRRAPPGPPRPGQAPRGRRVRRHARAPRAAGRARRRRRPRPRRGARRRAGRSDPARGPRIRAGAA